MNRRAAFITVIASGAAPTYTISGTVYDADGSTAVAGATVALGALSAVSAADGTYTISDVPAGTSGSMACTLAGYSWTAITVAAMSGNLTSQNYTNAWWAVGGNSAHLKAFYHPLGSASLADSYINRIDPGTANAAPGTAPTFDTSYGWSFTAASSQFLKCPLTPGDAWSVFMRYTEMTLGGTIRNFGSADAVVFSWRSADDAGVGDKIIAQHGGAALNVFFQQPTSGVIAIAGNQTYVDGVAKGTAIPAGVGGVYSAAIGIACLLSGTGMTASNFTNTKVQIFMAYDMTLTPAQSAIVSAGMAASTNPI